MPPYFSKPLPIPRPPNLFIYSQFTLHKSLKNYPKHFKTLHLEAKAQPLSKALLKSLLRRTKSPKALNLERYESFFDLKDPQALSLIKSFPHIQSLTLRGDTFLYYFTKSSIKWLTQSKQLIHLIYGDATRSQETDHRESKSKKSSLLKARQSKYEKTLKRTKILSFILQSHKALVSQEPHSFPPSLKQLSIISYGAIYGIFGGFSLKLSHLPNLSIFHLVLETFFGYILDTLDSLPNPQKLTHLSIRACNAFEKDTKSNLLIPDSLYHFRSLHSLNLTIFSFLFVSTLLGSFTNPSNLFQLSLHTCIRKRKQLKELGCLISSLHNLSLLTVTNQDSLEENAKKAYSKFFKGISGLSQLKSLKIALCAESRCRDDEVSQESLAQFAKCLEKMHELQDIDLQQSEFCPEEELKSLTEALKKKGSKLQKLRIKFIDKSQRDHLEKLNKAIQSMENLEELNLESLHLTKASAEEFGKAISDLKWLRSLKFDATDTKLDQATFTEVVRKILMKPGLRKLTWYGKKFARETRNLEEGGSIDIKEVIMRNPQLYKIDWGYDYQIAVFKNMEGFLSKV